MSSPSPAALKPASRSDPGPPEQALADRRGFGLRTIRLLLAISVDLVLVSAGLGAGIGLRMLANHTPIGRLEFDVSAGQMYLLCGLCWMAMMCYERVYSIGLHSADQGDRVIRALTGGLAVTILFSFVVHRSAALSRGVLFFWYGANLPLFMLARPVLMRMVSGFVRRPHVLVVAETPLAASSVCLALGRLGCSSQIVAPTTDPRAPELGRPTAVVLCLGPGERPEPLLARWEQRFSEVGIYPQAGGLSPFGARPLNLHGVQLFELRHPLDHPFSRGCKRTMDLVGASLLLVACSPLLAGLALAVACTSRGPLFYRQSRLGRDGRPFQILKFRSMVRDADAHLATVLARDAEAQQEFATSFKLKRDPRVTPAGRFLRRHSLDEVPQLWNVLRGDMSLVGPRPIVEAEVRLYGDVYPIVASVRPGMTGIWQISGRSDVSYESRCGFDVAYVREWSLWRDIAVLLRTVSAVVLPNAY
ncbi:MAG TPA: exopolysaccharide biosynthesis polyprenyl glycosylphosphotransferase [Terriglobales bacterium]|nr:exopolysaccharide biosynthesis polyprenyl glycosylphosphotransferase [Terriglobales bacterium]